MEKRPTSAKAVFDRALEIELPEDREAFLSNACAEDAQLRLKVEGLLRAYEQAGSFLESPPAGIAETVGLPEISERPGTVIGRYKLLQQIGEGGFGVVFMAEQHEPVERKVALKIIKPGMDTHAVVARFEAERQALAMMDHPNIAHVFDGGATESGRPYFVMELVRGVPITEYCDKNSSPTEERLRLFVEVCRAVQHAHQKGVIHRDLKPSNIMVTLHDGKPVPKVIDFGVAKATHQRLTEKTLFTAYGQMVGTPQYMSPEQAEMSGLDVDTRSDVYSLGVLLYELLTGTTPLDAERLREAGYAEMQRMIREDEPQKPSVRLSTSGQQLTIVAKHRSVDPKRLRQLVRGELDWITMKSLEKERSRRYESAASFADDVERFLGGEAVEACPPSAVYRMRKFARRHRSSVAAATAIVTVLVLGLIGTLVNMSEANRNAAGEKAQRQLAEQKTAEAEAEKERYRRLSYVTTMAAAEQRWEENDVPRTNDLLNRHRPEPGQTDLRGFEWFYLNRRSHTSAAPWINGRDATLFCMAVSDSGILALASRTSVTLHNIVDRSVIHGYPNEIGDNPGRFRDPASAAYLALPFVAISRSGQMLAYSVKGLEEAIVRDLATGAFHSIERKPGGVRTASFSGDGKLLATGGRDGQVTLWDARNGERIRDLARHSELVWSVAFSPNDTLVASGGADSKIYLSNVDSGAIFVLGEHDPFASGFDGVPSMVFSPDGKELVSGGADHTVRIWSVGERRLEHVLFGHTDEVRSVALSPDGRTIASGGRDFSVRVWEASTGRLQCVLKGPNRVVRSLAFSSDGERLFSLGLDDAVRVWDRRKLVDPDLLWCNSPVADVAISPDGNTAAAIQLNSTGVKIWRIGSDDEIPEADSIEMGRKLAAVAISRSLLLAAACRDGSIMLHDLSDTTRPSTLLEAVNAEPGARQPLAFSPDASTLAMGCQDGKIWIWEIEEGRRFALDANQGGVECLAYSADGKTLVSGGADKSVIVWDLTTRKEMRRLDLQARVLSVAASSDARTIATGDNKVIRLWDASTGVLKTQLSGSMNHHGIAFLDSQTLISASGDRTLRLWDLEHGELRYVLSGHVGVVWSMDASADGRTVVSGSWDGTVRLWRAPRE